MAVAGEIKKERRRVMKITVVKEEVKELERYYVVRAIRDTGLTKKFIDEKVFANQPTEEEIGLFLHESKADFCFVNINYRFI